MSEEVVVKEISVGYRRVLPIKKYSSETYELNIVADVKVTPDKIEEEYLKLHETVLNSVRAAIIKTVKERKKKLEKN